MSGVIALLASSAGSGGSDGLGQQIIEHVSNGPVIVPLHAGPIDLSITKHVVMLWVTALLVGTMFIWYARRAGKARDGVPSGRFATMVDFFVETIHNQIVLPNIGAKWAIAWTPLISAFFFFILVSNLIGLTPFMELLGVLGEKAHIPLLAALEHGSATSTGNFNVTAGLAVVTFGAIILAGSLAHGFVRHWKNIVPHGTPVWLLPLLLPIEILSMLVRPFALTMRLAANMTAGHIATVAILSVIFVFQSVLVGIPALALVVPLMGLEIIVCFVQAYVFTLLSTVFIGMAINVHH
jgi:F-type H+-transporting ATPase subunit a